MEDFNDDFLYEEERFLSDRPLSEKDFLEIAHRYIKDSFFRDGDGLSDEYIKKDGRKYTKCRYFLYFLNSYSFENKNLKVSDKCFHDYLLKQMLKKAKGLDYDIDFVFDLYDGMINFIEYWEEENENKNN